MCAVCGTDMCEAVGLANELNRLTDELRKERRASMDLTDVDTEMNTPTAAFCLGRAKGISAAIEQVEITRKRLQVAGVIA